MVKLYHDKQANVKKLNPRWLSGQSEPVMPPPPEPGEEEGKGKTTDIDTTDITGQVASS